MFRSILVPLDGSTASHVALPLAGTIAKDTGAAVTVLRVLPWPDAPEHREATADAATRLRRAADELSTLGVHVESVLRHGDAAEQILARSARQADLIVMRTHGRAGFERAVLGSVTQRVLQSSSVPLLVVRSGERHPVHLSKLLVPVDGSPGGAVALGAAVRLAHTTGAQLELVQVVVPLTTQVYAAYEFGGLAYYDPHWDEEALAAAQAYVEGLLRRLRDAGVVADGGACMANNVASAIVDAADSVGSDLIVMSTQALTGPARTLLGSVADAVVRTASCPVLLLHRTQPKDGHLETNGVEEPALAVG